jgi:hypothetical protein
MGLILVLVLVFLLLLQGILVLGVIDFLYYSYTIPQHWEASVGLSFLHRGGWESEVPSGLLLASLLLWVLVLWEVLVLSRGVRSVAIGMLRYRTFY